MFWRNSSLLYPTQSRIMPGRRIVALTFDDGPHSRVTPIVLDILAKYNIKATFFCVGKHAENYPEIARRAHDEGHILANHSFQHSRSFWFLGPEGTDRSIRMTGEVIRGITGALPRFYRAPVGIKTPPQAMAARKQKLVFVGWTRWPGDGGPQKLTVPKIRKLLSATRDGDIILLHDGKVDLSGNEVVKEAHISGMQECLPILIEGLLAKGLTPVRLDEMLKESAYSSEQAVELKTKVF
jgi:peptidoglycan-N-acetylglucosamine deacetylase